MNIVLQGEKQSFSHKAASLLYGSEDISYLYKKHFKEAFESVKHDYADIAIIPIENSTHGSIYENYDHITQYKFHIVAEIYIKISLAIFCKPEASEETLKTIYSHPVAFNQIKTYVQNHNHITFLTHTDTAGSLGLITDPSIGACAGSHVQKKGIKKLRENIEDNVHNFTRFFALSKDQAPLDFGVKKFKTTLGFRLGEESGSLAHILSAFARRNIALSHIQSRPILHTDWEYMFYLDALINTDTDVFKKISQEISLYTKDGTFTILGSYQVGQNKTLN